MHHPRHGCCAGMGDPCCCSPTPNADCQHEVLPVTSGHRLCLVYNLVFAGQGPPPPQLPQGGWAARGGSPGGVGGWGAVESYHGTLPKGQPSPLSFAGLAHRLAELVREWEAGLAAGDTGGEAGSGAAAAAAAAAGEAAGTSADGAAAAAAAAAGTSSAAATPKAPQKLCFMLAHRQAVCALHAACKQGTGAPSRGPYLPAAHPRSPACPPSPPPLPGTRKNRCSSAVCRRSSPRTARQRRCASPRLAARAWRGGGLHAACPGLDVSPLHCVACRFARPREGCN